MAKRNNPEIMRIFLPCRSEYCPMIGANMLLDKANPAKIIPSCIPVAFMLLAYSGRIGSIIPSPVMVMTVAINRVMNIFLFMSAALAFGIYENQI